MNKTYLSHHGIKGQRWGIRRYQNEDGSLTPAGEKRYGTPENLEQVRNRNKKIAIGVGIGAATATVVTGGIMLTRKNKQLRSELNIFKAKESERLQNLAKGRAKRMANIAAGIKKPRVYKIPQGSTVKISEPGKKFVKEYLNVVGGIINPGGKK